jgi:acylglycerol lipase
MGLFSLFQSQHAITQKGGVAQPTRTPPNPLFFPNYMQNKQGMWLYWRQWSPKVAPKGVVFFVGGLGEHGARYDSVAARFTARGFVAYSLDHQGQGGSEGDRKYVERFADYIEDTEQFIKQRLDADDGAVAALPRFVLGCSMGGLITVHLALRNPNLFNGVILESAAIEPDPKTATPFLKKAAAALSAYVPKMPLDALDAALLSRNPQVVQLAETDPCMPSAKMSARWGAEMLQAMDALWELMPRATFPLLLMHGSEDKICTLAGSEKLAQRAVSTDKQFRVYDGMYHELMTERGCEQVYVDLFAFVDGHMAAVPLTWE